MIKKYQIRKYFKIFDSIDHRRYRCSNPTPIERKTYISYFIEYNEKHNDGYHDDPNYYTLLGILNNTLFIPKKVYNEFGDENSNDVLHKYKDYLIVKF